MTFVPLDPKAEQAANPPCLHPEHNPPTYVVIFEMKKWRCPSCGREVLVRPNTVRL